jgi:hypothetical protein
MQKSDVVVPARNCFWGGDHPAGRKRAKGKNLEGISVWKAHKEKSTTKVKCVVRVIPAKVRKPCFPSARNFDAMKLS